MSELKFRAWDAGERKMHFVTMRELCRPKANDFRLAVDYAGAVVMLWSGTIDKNGVDVYESDIIRATDLFAIRDSQRPLPLLFADGFFCLLLDDGDFDCPDIAHTEVIGNAYENPELLEV